MRFADKLTNSILSDRPFDVVESLKMYLSYHEFVGFDKPNKFMVLFIIALIYPFNSYIEVSDSRLIARYTHSSTIEKFSNQIITST